MIVINSWNGTGRLTRDPEIKEVTGKNDKLMKIASFGIAVRKKYVRDNDSDTNFFEVKTFGYPANFVDKYVSKGTKLEIRGYLEQEQWTTKEGEKRSRIVIVAEEMEFAESKKANAESAAAQQQSEQKNNEWMEPPSGAEEEVPFR